MLLPLVGDCVTDTSETNTEIVFGLLGSCANTDAVTKNNDAATMIDLVMTTSLHLRLLARKRAVRLRNGSSIRWRRSTKSRRRQHCRCRRSASRRDAARALGETETSRHRKSQDR